MHASLKLAMNFIKALPGSTRLKIQPIRLHGIIAFLNTWIKRHMMHAQPPLYITEFKQDTVWSISGSSSSSVCESSVYSNYFHSVAAIII